MELSKRKAMFENLDNLIASAEKKVELLKQHKQGLIQHLAKKDKDGEN